MVQEEERKFKDVIEFLRSKEDADALKKEYFITQTFKSVALENYQHHRKSRASLLMNRVHIIDL